jgi:hypothetical protein
MNTGPIISGEDRHAAAALMGNFRTSFGRILDATHRKVAETLVGGWADRIEGGIDHLGPREGCRRGPRRRKDQTH